MQRVSVVQVAKRLGIGGTEKALELYTRYLNPEIFDVSVVGFLEGGVRGERLASMGFDVEIMYGSKEKIIKFLRQRRAQVVHVHRAGLPEPDLIRAIWESGVPVLLETNVFGRLDLTREAELFDKHLFVSKTCALRYIDWLGPDLRKKKRYKIGVLYNPVDFSEFDPDADEVDQECPLGIGAHIPCGSKVIGFIARPDPAKIAISYIVESLQAAYKNGINCYLLAVGMPEIFRHKFHAVGLAEYCIFLEPTPDPARLRGFYKSIDILLNASPIGETFGMVIAEAMANRKPVVTNYTPLHDMAQIELVDHDETGYVAYGPQAFAEAAVELLLNPQKCAQMGDQGYRKAKTEYDVVRLAKALGNLYIELLHRKGMALQVCAFPDSQAYRLPTYEDVEAFRAEYWERLRRYRGSVPRWQLLAHRLLRNRYFFAAARRLKQFLKLWRL